MRVGFPFQRTPPVKHSNGIQAHALSGAVLFSHYLLSHNIGGNVSDKIRKALYCRIKADVHNHAGVSA